MRRKSSSCCSSSSSKSENGEEPRLSGAYIRSLVKELASSRTKDPVRDNSNIDNTDSNIAVCDEKDGKSPRQRKQGRRRVHKDKPYKEKLMNMAEARKEIVTALKLHRAAMKAKEEQKSGLENQGFGDPRRNPSFNFPVNYGDSSVFRGFVGEKSGPGNQAFEPESGKEKSRRNPRFYHPNNSLVSDIFPVGFADHFVYPPGFVMPKSGPESENSRMSPRNYASKSLNSDNFVPVDYAGNFFYPPGFHSPYSWPVFSADIPLPRQTLGLNLNLQEFNNLERNSVYSNMNPSSIYSASSASITSSSPGFSISNDETNPGSQFGPDSGLSSGMDDSKETAEISKEEEHKIEMNDCLNSLNIEKGDDDDFVSSPFDEIMEFPEWMNATNDGSLLQNVNDECFQDPALPCMEIEEIEGIDGEWLA